MNFEDIANEDEFNEENSSNKKSIKNSFNNSNFNNNNNEQNNIKESDNINEINNSINKDSISDKEIDKEKEEKALLEEIKALEKDKEQFFQKRKEQNDILDKYMDLLKSLQTKNEIELKNISIEDTNFELGELIKYNSLINEIESEERILEEEEMYFEQYKNNYNRMYEEKQKEIENMGLNYEKDKEELDKKMELLEMEEKMINDKYNNFEYEKKIMTERYNNAINKEAALAKSKMKIENTLAELDRRNLIIQKNNQFINDTKNELNYQIAKNSNDEKRILYEINNLKLRQDMIDSLRMKYVGDLTNNPFELMSKTFNENERRKQLNNFNHKIIDYNNSYSTFNQKGFNKYNYDEEKNNINNNYNNVYNKYEENMNNNSKENNQKKLSIIEEDKKISDKSESINEI